MKSFSRIRRIARQLGSLLVLLAALSPAAADAADVACPAVDSSGMAANYLAEVFALTFCWQSLGTGLTYQVETSTNRGAWIQEATVSDNHVSLRRDLGNRLQVRLSMCQGSLCSPPSDASKLTYIWPNFDADGSGQVTMAD